MQICPVNRECLYNYIWAPFFQGWELVKQAWKGVDFHSLPRPPLSLKDRVISLIVGAILLLPVINCIVWLAWQTFGTPEKLFDPYCPNKPLPPSLIPPSHLEPPALEEGTSITEFSFKETISRQEINADWQVEHRPTSTIVHQISPLYSCSARYVADPPDSARKIVEYNYTSKEDGNFHMWFLTNKPGQFSIRAVTKEGDLTFQLEEEIPWIQQPTIGFKEFILSKDQTIYFYGVLPKNPNPLRKPDPVLMKCVAKKIKNEEPPGHGSLVKVEVSSTWGWPYSRFQGELWFDRTTGELRKFIDPGIITHNSGERVLNRPQPVSAHR